MSSVIQTIPSSYRDPSGFMFEKDGRLLRQVNQSFKEDFDLFISCGCYQQLVDEGLLIPHRELPVNFTQSGQWYKTLEPEKIDFISYPYEWCFDMLKDAALLTLSILKKSLAFGLIVKDGTPFNIQWKNGRPVFIDTLSFERYNPSQPWIAYRQFCENFLAPLLLMHYKKIPLQGLQLAWPDGIPLPVAQALLPWKSKLSFFTWLHIHLHSRMATKHAGKTNKPVSGFSEKKLDRLIVSLESLITTLRWQAPPSVWEHYYEEANTRNDYISIKKNIINGWIGGLSGVTTVADIGGNNGEFSMLKSLQQKQVICTDFDHSAINDLYKKVKEEGISNILPLVMDIANPSPAIGLQNTERSSFHDRCHVDLCLCLALLHHLAIGRNIPLERICQVFSQISNNLVIEFVPKSDEKVQQMLSAKKDIYENYNEQSFEDAFKKTFSIIHKNPIGESGRILYLMKKNG